MFSIKIHKLLQGSISFEKGLLFEAAKKKKQQFWITLFDQLDDDLYDGDFTEDDPEMPKIQFWFKKSAPQTSKQSKKAEPIEVERNDAHNVENLK